MDTLQAALNGSCATPNGKRPKLRDAIAAALHGALTTAFSGWHGGGKALARAAELAPNTTRRYMSGERSMRAVELLLVCFRCPHFVAALGERLHQIGHADGLLDGLRGRVRRLGGRARAKAGALRLRFRRQKERA